MLFDLNKPVGMEVMGSRSETAASKVKRHSAGTVKYASYTLERISRNALPTPSRNLVAKESERWSLERRMREYRSGPHGWLEEKRNDAWECRTKRERERKRHRGEKQNARASCCSLPAELRVTHSFSLPLALFLLLAKTLHHPLRALIREFSPDSLKKIKSEREKKE